MAAAAWRQRGLCGRLLLVDCCLFLPPPITVAAGVFVTTLFVTEFQNEKKNVVKIVYIPNWNCLLFN